MPEQIRTGRCLCGEIRFRASGPWRDLCICHCRSCRLATGAPSAAWGTIDRENFHLIHGELTQVRSSKDVRRGFCGRCGTALTYSHTEWPNEINVTLASLDDSSGLAPKAHIWVQEKLSWDKIPDGLPQHDGALEDDD